MKTSRTMLMKAGFSLTEVMIAVSLFGFVAVAGYTAFRHASRLSRAGGYQVEFNTVGRNVVRWIARYVEHSKAVGVRTNGLDMIADDLTHSMIEFQDGDGDISTVEDNKLVYDPDTEAGGEAVVLCTHVSPIDGESMFSILGTSPNAVRVCFHVGDGTNTTSSEFSRTGPGYQGVEVRMSATPRNLQRWYD